MIAPSFTTHPNQVPAVNTEASGSATPRNLVTLVPPSNAQSGERLHFLTGSTLTGRAVTGEQAKAAALVNWHP